VNAEAGHGVSQDPHEEGGLLVFDQVFVETQALFIVVGGRRGETGRYWAGEQRATRQGNAWKDWGIE
jgi:hypothetical protein